MAKFFIPSANQVAIFNWIKNGTGDACVNAKAGSGKTTTIKQAASLIEGEGLFCAFNRHIAEGLKDALTDTRMRATTIHAFGFGVTSRALVGRGKLDVKEDKYQKIATKFAERLAEPELRMAVALVGKEHAEARRIAKATIRGRGKALAKLVDMVRLTRTISTNTDALCELMTTYDITTDGPIGDAFVLANVRAVLDEGIELAETTKTIDYTDMIWLPLVLRLPVPTFAWVFVDECFPGDTPVTLANGDTKTIREIVESRASVEVLCYNEQTSKVEARPVTGWHKVPRRGRPIVRNGKVSSTDDHPVFTRERGYVQAKQLAGLHVMELRDEEVRSSGGIESDGAIDYRRIATWRRIDTTEYVEREARECTDRVRPGDGTTGIPSLETNDPSAVRGYTVLRNTDTNGVRGECSSLRHTLPSGYNEDSGIVQASGGEKEAHPTGNSRGTGHASTSRVVHGRWIDLHVPRDDSNLRLPGCGDGDRRTYLVPERDGVQGGGVNQRRNTPIHGEGEGSATGPNWSDRPLCPVHDVQDGTNGGSDLYGMREVIHPEEVSFGDIARNMFAGMCAGASVEDTESEWVYCLDVAEHHNFFASGTLVHNCQDLNACQRDLILRARGRYIDQKTGETAYGRFLFVGDDRQAIMGFAGADTRSFWTIQETLSAAVLPLDICYRCPKTHVQLAANIVPDIRHAPTAKTGEIRAIFAADAARAIDKGDLIMCRKTAPLVGLCLRLIRAGKPAQVRGRDIAAQLIELTDTIQEIANTYPPCSFMEALQRWEDAQAERLRDLDDAEQRIERIRDMAESLRVCFQEWGSAEAMKAKIASIFADSDAAIWLSTVHKAKGLEADNAFILHPRDMPMTRKGQTAEQFQQELNILYVALTRAKKVLTFILKDGEADPTDWLDCLGPLGVPDSLTEAREL